MYIAKNKKAQSNQKYANIKRTAVKRSFMTDYMNECASEAEKNAFKAEIKKAREVKKEKYLDEVKKVFLNMFYEKQKQLFEDTF